MNVYECNGCGGEHILAELKRVISPAPFTTYEQRCPECDSTDLVREER